MKRTLTTLCLLALASCGGGDATETLADDNDAGIVAPHSVYPACPSGREWCGFGCEDLQTSDGNCGACNLMCPRRTHCAKGKCVE